MIERGRFLRQVCNMPSQVFLLYNPSPASCNVVDASAFGAFIEFERDVKILANFDLIMSQDPTSRSCRIARRAEYGVEMGIVEMLYSQVEELLVEYAFKEEMVSDMICGVDESSSLTRSRLKAATSQIVDFIVNRNVISWLSNAEAFRNK